MLCRAASSPSLTAQRHCRVGDVPCRDFEWAPNGTHCRAGAILLPHSALRERLAPAPAERSPASIKPSPLGTVSLGDTCSVAGRCVQEWYDEGAGWFHTWLLPQAARSAGRAAVMPSLQLPSPGAPASPLPGPTPPSAPFPPALLFFPVSCEKVQSACDRFSSLPSPFPLVKTAILEQPSGLVKGYL